MELFTRTYLQGMHDSLVDAGVMRPFPSDAHAVANFDKIASDVQLPPILEAQLSMEAGLKLAQRLKQASDQLALAGQGPTAKRLAMAKNASLYDLEARASVAASFFMEKAAAEGSLVDNDENTLANAVKSDQLAAVDNRNRSEGTYRTPRGETDLPVPGVVGREVPAPHAPTTGTTVKAADASLVPSPGHPGLGQHGETWGSRKNQILDLLGMAPQGDTARVHGAGTRQALSNVGQTLKDHFLVDPRKQLGLAQSQHSMMQGLEEGSDALSKMRSARNANIGGLAAQGLGAAGAVAGLGLGAHALYQKLHQPSTEDMQGMEVQASDAGPLARTLTFLVGLHQKTAGTWIPSEEAKLAAAGLGAAGNPGLEAMSTILGRAKTADDAESELHQVLQILDAQGIPPSPELVQALAEALGEGDPGGAPEGGPPPGLPAEPPVGGEGGDVPKMGSMLSAQQALHGAEKVLAGTKGSGLDAAREALSRATRVGERTSTLGRNGGRMLSGAAAAAAAMGAKTLYDKTRGNEKEAADAFWVDILKSAGEGSLTEVDENTLANAAKDDQLAEVDQKNRPEGKYKKPQGQTALSTEAGEVGAEKKVAEEAYMANLKQAAADWGSKLPAALPIEKKREAIAKIASLAPSARATYVQSLQG